MKQNLSCKFQLINLLDFRVNSANIYMWCHFCFQHKLKTNYRNTDIIFYVNYLHNITSEKSNYWFNETIKFCSSSCSLVYFSCYKPASQCHDYNHWHRCANLTRKKQNKVLHVNRSLRKKNRKHSDKQKDFKLFVIQAE